MKTLGRIIGILFVVPLVYLLLRSFMDSTQLMSSVESGFIPFTFNLDQYLKILYQHSEFFLHFVNSVVYTLVIISANLIVCITAAYYLTRSQWRFKFIIIVMYAFLALMPDQITMVPNIVFFQWVENHLGIALMDSMLAIMIPSAFNTLGIVFLKLYFDTIPKSFFEVAELEGASHLFILRKVVVSYAKYPIMALSMFILMDTWGMMDRVLVFINDVGKYPGSVFLSRIQGDPSLYNVASILYVTPIIVMMYAVYNAAKRYIYNRKELNAWEN